MPTEVEEGAREDRGAPVRPSLAVIVPAYNERDTIQEALRRVRALDADVELIVVDDASTDGTRELLEAESGLILVKHPENRGKGASIRSGLERVSAGVVAIQ